IPGPPACRRHGTRRPGHQSHFTGRSPKENNTVRTLSILLAIASLATFPAAWANHRDYDAGGGPYVGLETAANFLSDQGIHENGEEPGNLHFDTGFLIGLVGGYALDNGLRPELEL